MGEGNEEGGVKDVILVLLNVTNEARRDGDPRGRRRALLSLAMRRVYSNDMETGPPRMEDVSGGWSRRDGRLEAEGREAGSTVPVAVMAREGECFRFQEARGRG